MIIYCCSSIICKNTLIVVNLYFKIKNKLYLFTIIPYFAQKQTIRIFSSTRLILEDFYSVSHAIHAISIYLTTFDCLYLLYFALRKTKVINYLIPVL